MARLRDHRTLQEEAATVRAQAKAVHQAAIDNLGHEHESWGARRDAAMRDAGTARANANQADKQANELYERSREHAEQAGELDAEGARVVDSRPLEAEETFEQAQGWVRHAEALSQRADAAREVARDWAQKADELEKQAEAIDNEPNPPTFVAPQLSVLADQLDEKARLLEEAAQKQIDAANEQAAGDPGAASASRNWANYALQRADATQLDYGSLDPQVLRAAGIPRSQIPDSALMDPNDLATAPAAPVGTGASTADDVSGASRYDDTDLMDPGDSAPSAAAAVDAASPASDDVAAPADDGLGEPAFDSHAAYDPAEFGTADASADAYSDADVYDGAYDASDVSDVSAYEPSFDA